MHQNVLFKRNQQQCFQPVLQHGRSQLGLEKSRFMVLTSATSNGDGIVSLLYHYIISELNYNRRICDSGFPRVYLLPPPPPLPSQKLRICTILMTWSRRGWGHVPHVLLLWLHHCTNITQNARFGI